MPINKDVLVKYINNDIFIETGTLKGKGVKVALNCGFKKIYSIENDYLSFKKVSDKHLANELSLIHI